MHGYRNATDEPAAMLVLFAPGIAREKYFEELAEIRTSGRTLSDEEWADLFARHDQVNLRPATGRAGRLATFWTRPAAGGWRAW